MKALQVSFLILLFCLIFIRPDVPEDTYFRGGSVQDAVLVLAEASVNEKSTLHSRALDDAYSHWAKASTPEENGGETAVTLAGVKTANEDSPLVAGIVGLAAVTGLRELASIFLYLLSDYGESNNDLDLVDICLRAIPFVDPHFVDAYIIRGYFFALTQPIKSEEILLRGLRWNPEDWELYSDLAWLYLRNTSVRKPQPLTALKYLKAAMMVKHPYLLERLYGFLLAHVGQKEEAFEVFNKMIADPSISYIDLKQAEKGLDSLKRGEDRMARIFNKEIGVGKQEGTVPVCTHCGHHHAPGLHTHDHDDTGHVHTDHDDTGHVHTDHDDTGHVHTDHDDTGHVHGPDCNH
jgi:tetratricopeptide (TPR) repeat protein